MSFTLFSAMWFFFLSFSLSCEEQEADSIALDDAFNIYFHQDFDNKIPGIYQVDEWSKDWNYPEWVDRQIPPLIIAEKFANKVSQFMRWNFPAGSVGPSEGGGQWITHIEEPFEEVYFSYNLRFKPGFNWVKGGKIPGLNGGPGWDGVAPPPWDAGFIVLLMWATGNLEFYYYHHNQTHIYGDWIAWDYPIETGKWYNITMRIVLNTVDENGGHDNGIMEGFIDGKLVAQLGNVRFRNLDNIFIDQLYMTSFFGGSGNEFAAARDEWIDVDDFILFTYKDAVDVPRGNTMSDADKKILLPYHYLK